MYEVELVLVGGDVNSLIPPLIHPEPTPVTVMGGHAYPSTPGIHVHVHVHIMYIQCKWLSNYIVGHI